MLSAGLDRADEMLADAIDRVKTSREDRPLVAVGGGSILVPERLPGISEIHRPAHHDVANAIGAAIASVSGEVDRIFHLGGGGRHAAIDEHREVAVEHRKRLHVRDAQLQPDVRDHGRLGPRGLVLERDRRHEQHVRAAHAV
jgi:N-methylhydantoinase A/oxoprolinase/acetone carboxylase beta subunit